jgi:hypothetical protein
MGSPPKPSDLLKARPDVPLPEVFILHRRLEIFGNKHQRIGRVPAKIASLQNSRSHRSSTDSARITSSGVMTGCFGWVTVRGVYS